MKTDNTRILVVDDEKEIVNVVKAYLEKENYKVITAEDGEKALEVFKNFNIDFIVLDLMMPKISGEEVCKKIRLKSSVPILMLTAKVEESELLKGLDIGADDYMTKPFSPRELVARVRTILRRTQKEAVKANIIEFNEGDLIVDKNKREVKKGDSYLKLTPTEFDILIYLSENTGRVFSRSELVTKILGYDYDGYDRTIDVHIKNIRHKIEDDKFKYIKTVYGVGYQFLGE